MYYITSKFGYDNSSSVWHRSLVLKWYSLHIHLFNRALFRTENLWVSGKQRRQKVPAALHEDRHFEKQQDTFEALFASTSICLRLRRGGGLGGGAGYGIPMGLEYFQKFLDKPMQRGQWFWRALIYFENSISPLRLSLLRLWSYKSEANGRSCGEWTKVSAFPFEIQHHGVSDLPHYLFICVYLINPIYAEGWNSLPSRFFSPCFHKYQQISSKFSVFNFLLWKHALENEKACGKLLTHFSLYLYKIFNSYFFSFLTYLVLIEWKKTHPVGHLSLSKHWNLANLLLTSALLKKYRILIIFLAFFNPEFNNCMLQLAIFWLNCDE